MVDEKGKGGNMLQFYEYKINPDKKSRKFGPTGIPDSTASANKRQNNLMVYVKKRARLN